MFSNSTTKLKEDKEATKSNLHTLLSSEQGEFLGDPAFGVKIKAYMFEQNNSVLRDILIDELYEQIRLFIPQLKVDRKDIKLTSDGTKITALIKATNRRDYTTDLYTLCLFDENSK